MEGWESAGYRGSGTAQRGPPFSWILFVTVDRSAQDLIQGLERRAQEVVWKTVKGEKGSSFMISLREPGSWHEALKSTATTRTSANYWSIQQDMAAFIACESCPSFTGEKKHLNKRKRKDLMRPGMVLSSHSRAPGFCRRWRWDKGQLSTNDLHLAAAKMKVPSVLSLRQLPHCSLMNGGSTKHGHLEGWALWDVDPGPRPQK